MDYVRIEATAERDAAHFRHMLHYENDWKLRKGRSVADEFPMDAAYRMSDDYPENIALHDVLHNLDGLLIVSSKLRAFLEEQDVQDVEYLPVNVFNHKDRAVDETYYVVNILRMIDCIDKEQTEFKWNRLNPEEMKKVKNLTIDESRIDPDCKLFRLHHLRAVMLMRRDLAEQMHAAGFRGFVLTELEDYTWG